MVQSDLQTLKTQSRNHARLVHAGLAGVLLLYCVMSCVGITWGLPSRKIDKFLFGDGEAWSGEKIYRLAHADEKLSAARISSTGADVDVNPIGRAPTGSVLLTATEEDVARIYLRYRLYTHQPDEMITMMALAGMRPGALQLDPRLYQYGGLFIYPVGALIKLCGMLGLIDVRSDIVFYLDHPDEFGRFYVVARAYSAAWGLVGVIVVFALTKRLSAAFQDRSSKIEDRMADKDAEAQRHSGTHRNTNYAGLLASLLFTLMPVVVCMSHEGKPHLPGAVLMLLSVYLVIRALSGNRQSTIDNRKFFWLMCVCCGAAVGMVLSSWPICVLIPLAAAFQFRRPNIEDRSTNSAAYRTLLGGVTALVVYFASNPYVLINVFVNREVLRSSFGNSLAMYHVDRIGEGLLRVLELMVEGATLPVVVLGTLALIIGLATSIGRTMAFGLLIVPAALFFAQFVLLGAGKPAEYGRFAIFSNAALAIGAACLLCSWIVDRLPGMRFVLAIVLVGWVGVFGAQYLQGFYRDTAADSSRLHLASRLSDPNHIGWSGKSLIALDVEPAPYSCPPLDFASQQVWLVRDARFDMLPTDREVLFVRTLDREISWANKRFIVTDSGGSIKAMAP